MNWQPVTIRSLTAEPLPPQGVPGPKRFGNHWFKESTGQYKTCYEDTTRESTKAAFRLELCKRHDHIQSQCNDTSQSELASSCLRILSSERASNADRRDQSEATRATVNRYLKSSLNAALDLMLTSGSSMFNLSEHLMNG